VFPPRARDRFFHADLEMDSPTAKVDVYTEKRAARKEVWSGWRGPPLGLFLGRSLYLGSNVLHPRLPGCSSSPQQRWRGAGLHGRPP